MQIGIGNWLTLQCARVRGRQRNKQRLESCSCNTKPWFGIMSGIGVSLLYSCSVFFTLQAIIVVYGFHHPYLLSHQIQESENQAFYKNHILKIILRGPTLSFFAAIVSFFFIPLAYVFLGLVIFFPHVSHLTKWFKSKVLGQEDEVPLESFTSYLTEPLSKERVEAFSDGVYAIVATLLILDIW